MESATWTLEDLRTGLLSLRSDAGAPSYTEISRRIAKDRSERGLPEAEQHVARATVHHAFQPGRRRISEELLRDILRALGVLPDVAEHWLRVSRSAQRRLDASAVVSVQDQVPEPTSPYVRRGVADEALDLIYAGCSLVVLEGMPGSGKTQLALQVAQRLLARTAITRCLHVDLRGYHHDQPPVDPAAALDAAVRVMGVGPGPAGQAGRRYADHLDQQPRVIVLDDAAHSEQVLPLLAATGRSVVLVTSRTALDLPGATRVQVGSYTPEESTALLVAVVGKARVHAEPETAQELLSAAAHLPLAVSLVASRVASRTDWTLSDHVDLMRHRQRGLRLDETVHTNLTRSYVELSPTARAALRLLSAQPFPSLERSDARALVEHDSVNNVLDELTSHHLVAGHGAHGLRLHPLVQTFGLDQSLEEDPPSARRDALARLADHFVAMTWSDYLHQRTDAPRQPPHGVEPATVDTDEARAWTAASTENLLLLAANAREWDLEDRVPPLSAALAHWLNVSGRYRDGVELHELAIAAAVRGGDEQAGLLARLDLGMSLVRQDDWEGAAPHLHKAQAGFESAGRVSEAREALNALAIMDAQQGRHAEAAAKFARCAELAVAAGELAGLGAALDNTAIVLRRLHRYDEALAHHRRARDVAHECANTALEARSLVNAAALLVALRRPEEALESATEGLALADENGIVPVSGYGHDNLGSALQLLGQPEEASDHHRAALTIAADLGDAHLELAALIGLGEDLHLVDPVSATSHLERGLALAESVGEPLDQVRAWHCLASIAEDLGDAETADRWRTASRAYVDDLPSHEQDLIGEWTAHQPG